MLLDLRSLYERIVVTRQISVGMEALASIAGTQVSLLESMATIVGVRSVGMESMSPVIGTRISSVESLSSVTITALSQQECVALLGRSAMAQIESLSVGGPSVSGASMEAVQSVSRESSHLIEGLQGIRQIVIIPTFALKLLNPTAVSGMESLQPVGPKSAQAIMEGLLGVGESAIVTTESIRRMVETAKIAIESLAKPDASHVSSFEALDSGLLVLKVIKDTGTFAVIIRTDIQL